MDTSRHTRLRPTWIVRGRVAATSCNERGSSAERAATTNKPHKRPSPAQVRVKGVGAPGPPGKRHHCSFLLEVLEIAGDSVPDELDALCEY